MVVAETVEALVSHRRYRPWLGVAAARAEIADNAGVKYDAGVVQACLSLMDSGAFPQVIATVQARLMPTPRNHA